MKQACECRIAAVPSDATFDLSIDRAVKRVLVADYDPPQWTHEPQNTTGEPRRLRPRRAHREPIGLGVATAVAIHPDAPSRRRLEWAWVPAAS